MQDLCPQVQVGPVAAWLLCSTVHQNMRLEVKSYLPFQFGAVLEWLNCARDRLPRTFLFLILDRRPVGFTTSKCPPSKKHLRIGPIGMSTLRSMVNRLHLSSSHSKHLAAKILHHMSPEHQCQRTFKARLFALTRRERQKPRHRRRHHQTTFGSPSL